MSLQLQNVEAVLAVDIMNGLAKNNQIPWKSKTDMKFFKNKTIYNTVIMGSKTLLSLPNAAPLKNRINIVITSNKEMYLNKYRDAPNIFFFDIEEIIVFMKKNTNTKFYIIGGNKIYNLLLPYCSRIWLTKIKKDYKCDLMFNYNISVYTKEVIYDDSELEIQHLH
uniref:dihydrofolate reductase n=1 Tax=viral metagenome TaxID=1070528 RepID=A0A6C0BUH5_9ZZZZ